MGSGWLLDRLGARVVLLAGAMLIGAGSILTAVAPNLGMALLLSLLVGIGIGCLEVGPRLRA